MGPSENCAADLQFYRDVVGGKYGTTSTLLKVVSYGPSGDVHPTGVCHTHRALKGLTCTNAPPTGPPNTRPAVFGERPPRTHECHGSELVCLTRVSRTGAGTTTARQRHGRAVRTSTQAQWGQNSSSATASRVLRGTPI